MEDRVHARRIRISPSHKILPKFRTVAKTSESKHQKISEKNGNFNFKREKIVITRNLLQLHS